MSATVNLSAKIANIAKQELGFALVGIVPAEPSQTFTQYVDWLDHGYAGEMDWIHTEGRKAKRANVRNIMPEAKTVISLAYSYYTQDLPSELLNDPSRGIFARYAWGRDYHKVLKAKLRTLICMIETQIGHQIKAKAYVDTGPILERELAQRAGLGFIGNNSLMINSSLGSYLFLCEILLAEELDPWVRGGLVRRSPAQRGVGGCRRCTKCIDTCPTKAIVKPYVIDANKCISYLTIEHRGVIPEAIRPLMKNRIYGCDICQEVCPWNSLPKAKQTKSDWLQATVDIQAPLLSDLAKLTDETFLARFQGTPVMRVKRHGLLRNVAVALGNWGVPVAVPSLELLANDSNELIQQHARWGLDQIH